MNNSRKDFAPERREKLKELIRRSGVARSQELCRKLNVSSATIRRDLKALEAEGTIRRVYGGAVSIETRLDEPLFDDKTGIASREKRRIAKEAAESINPGETIYLDGGSTVLKLARLLTERTDITVVTNSLRAAIELSGRGPRVVLVGGELRRLSQTMVGPLSSCSIEQLHVDKAFMGTMGIDRDGNMTTTDPNEAYTKKLAAQNADLVILLADHSKLGKVSFTNSGTAEDVDVLITDKGANPAFVKQLRKNRIRVLRV